MNPKEHIRLHETEFTKSEKIIEEYVLKNFDTISSYPIQEVAKKCKVSKSALLRFCQKCGFRGYSEFRYEVSRYVHSMVEMDTDDDNSSSIYLSLYANRIQQLQQSTSSQFLDHIIQLIKDAYKIKIYGIHETGLSAQYLSYRLCTIGIDSEAIVNSSIMTEKALMSNQDDLNIFLSLSAETTVIKDAIQYAYESHSKIILVTQNNHHSFHQKIDKEIILPTFNNEDLHFFIDSQALVFITIDLIINHLAKNLQNQKNKTVCTAL
ncbi:MurR/RpiR family transcriptional regulator [Allocoprobacillus halotolerans]|uniref:MurR/RpiR family transcriptional regulator n=1 Tax=Allocoprobacillus halotolerans TaxID=2944914 RepID=A0ABY5I4V7_9FIRM|nr:MurR/RpiR family transcriptional regulator [Allocoprobacillus halotolerans]UTY39753.1 MurR/RpiR family transcriptional regulator [Allocoprobacillus halotolerans]